MTTGTTLTRVLCVLSLLGSSPWPSWYRVWSKISSCFLFDDNKVEEGEEEEEEEEVIVARKP